ncbi:hypothetical protein CLCHR_30610 [Clostridium chromiireducens]|uniref:Uncharacterized protein n=1 Tax=Clostridium chromiireducens TaxID=225345 RepID=A0A1V4IJE5_9CLOT|nr:hypothetical protein CLCHR_30610 [Clostridium chromiireducens]
MLALSYVNINDMKKLIKYKQLNIMKIVFKTML